jgi:hypothetical protein
MAIVGGATSFLAAYGVDSRFRPSMLVLAAIGAAVGGLFGLMFRRLVIAWLRLPILAWIPISLVLGGLWGGAVASIGVLLLYRSDGIPVLAGFGAIAGALQLGWFWLPYAIRSGRGNSTWPVVTAAIVVGSVIGYAALWLLLAIWRPALN